MGDPCCCLWEDEEGAKNPDVATEEKADDEKGGKRKIFGEKDGEDDDEDEADMADPEEIEE